MPIRKLKNFYEKNERYFSPMALVLGFIWDNLTLRRIDLWLENLSIFIYILIAYASILFLSVYDSGRLRHRFFEVMGEFVPFALQFAFGGLFSAFFIFYSKSASLAASWPFMFFLVFMLVGNEVFRQKYLRFVFRISVFFVVLFSYLIFAVPVLLGKMGAWVFLLSGLASLGLIYLAAVSLFRLTGDKFLPSRFPLFLSIAGIYLIFNIFYFFNIIPPVPLALKESGIYHQVEWAANGQYLLRFENPPWYLFFRDFNYEVHWLRGMPVYAYSAVFAPTKLNADILHRWSYFDEEKDEWVEKSRLGFSVKGGRDGGYRGYTVKRNLEAGEWRVDVITKRGQVLGRIKFRIVETDSLPDLSSELR